MSAFIFSLSLWLEIINIWIRVSIILVLYTKYIGDFLKKNSHIFYRIFVPINLHVTFPIVELLFCFYHTLIFNKNKHIGFLKGNGSFLINKEICRKKLMAKLFLYISYSFPILYLSLTHYILIILLYYKYLLTDYKFLNLSEIAYNNLLHHLDAYEG